MRVVPFLVSLLIVGSPRITSGQPFLLNGSAGPTLIDRGYSLAAGAGWSPTLRITLLLDVERTHLASRLRSDGRGGVAGFRGGTLTMAAPELRVTLLGRDRIGPYGLAGFAAGVSRPHVNERFPDPVTNDVRAIFFGGGIHLPIRNRIDLFADARIMIGSEAGESLAIAPLRAGIAWRF